MQTTQRWNRLALKSASPSGRTTRFWISQFENYIESTQNTHRLLSSTFTNGFFSLPAHRRKKRKLKEKYSASFSKFSSSWTDRHYFTTHYVHALQTPEFQETFLGLQVRRQFCTYLFISTQKVQQNLYTYWNTYFLTFEWLLVFPVGK